MDTNSTFEAVRFAADTRRPKGVIKLQHIAAQGRQRWFRFVVAGTAITLVSQGALRVLLGVLPVIAATLLRKLLCAGCGYLTSARAVYSCSGIPQGYMT